MDIKKLAPICLLILFLNSGVSTAQGEERGEPSQCISCHELLDEELAAPVHSFANDIHKSKGLSCHDCHGGDPLSDDAETAMSREKGFIAIPDEFAIPQFCGRCHSNPDYMRTYNPGLAVDQMEKYWTSIHGKRNASGDRKAAQCVSCHSSHEIRPALDPLSRVNDVNVPKLCAGCHSDAEYMKEYTIATDQYDTYARGVHGIALLVNKDRAAPACNDCHSNHGASPPGVASVAFVCGNCHANNMELFNASPMRESFTNLHLPGCGACHGNHDIQKPTDALLGVGKESTCMNCHSADNRPEGYKMAIEIKESLARLNSVETSADSVVRLAAEKGMEVTNAEYKLRDVRQALIEARTLVHSFDQARVKEKVDEGLVIAREARTIGEKAVRGYYFRRKWIGVSTLLISLLILGLFLKLREIERKR